MCGHTRAKMRANTGRGSRLVQSRPTRGGDSGSVAMPALLLRRELRRSLLNKPMVVGRHQSRGRYKAHRQSTTHIGPQG